MLTAALCMQELSSGSGERADSGSQMQADISQQSAPASRNSFRTRPGRKRPVQVKPNLASYSKHLQPQRHCITPFWQLAVSHVNVACDNSFSQGFSHWSNLQFKQPALNVCRTDKRQSL